MNKHLQYILLCLLPLLFFIYCCELKYSLGEYYLNLYDPGYVYLINSLNLAQLSGYGVGHIDHPGTPVQIAGAVILKLYFAFGNNSVDIVNDVLNRPEDYLFVINKIFVIINTIALYIFGLIVFKVSRNYIAAFFLQISPFISGDIFYGLIDVSPDNFLILASLAVIALLLYYLCDERITELSPKLILLFALICGFGLACKLNFIPVFFIPIYLIKGIKSKLRFILFSILFFIIFTLPALENYEYFSGWIKNLFIHSSIYGQGDESIIDKSSFLGNIIKIFSANYMFAVIYIISVSAAVFGKYFLKVKYPDSYSIEFKKVKNILNALIISFTVQILIVAKHYHPFTQKYMIPALMLSAIALYLSFKIYFGYFKFIYEKTVYLLMIILLLIWNFSQVFSLNEKISFQKNESLNTENYLKENYPDEHIISDLESSDNDKSLAFIIFYAGSQTNNYIKLLSEKFKTNIFYSGWADQFIFTSDTNLVRDQLSGGNKVILQISKYASLEKFSAKLKELLNTENVTYEKVYENKNGESVFEFTIKKTE